MLAVLSPPLAETSWWTADRVAVVFGILLALLMLGLVWSVALLREVRRRTEALRESEEKFATAFRDCPDAIVITRLSDGTILDVNERFSFLSGYTKGEAVGRTSVELAWDDPADREKLVAELRAFGRVRDFPSKMRNAGGEVRHVVLSSAPIVVGGAACLLGIVRDVTEEKRRQAALEASERKFEALFRLSPVGMILSRFDDGTILEVNRGYLDMMGFTREELLGKTSVELGLLRAEERAAFVTLLHEEGRIVETEYPRTRKDGSPAIHSASIEAIEIDGEQLLIVCAIDVTARRQAERALIASERKFSTLFHASPYAVMISRFEDGTILELNAAFAELTGYPREDLLNRSSLEVGLWANPTDRSEIVAELRAGRRVRNRDVRLRRADGDIRDIWLSMDPVEIDGESRILGALNDATDFLRVERAVFASERKYNRLFQIGPFGVIISRVGDGQILEVNPAFAEMTGYERERLIGNSGLDLGLWVDRAERHRVAAELKARGRVRNIDARLRHASGEVLELLLSVEPMEIDGEEYALTAVQDITERRRVERALIASEKKFGAVFRLSPVALVLTQIDGTIREANLAFETLFQIPRDEAVGKRATDFPQLYDSPEDRATLGAQLTQTGHLREVERRRILPDGAAIDTIASAELIDLDGVPHALVAVTDVGPLKRAEAALREANATLERRVAERTDELRSANAELEAFCYSVSHDLRAPLRSIDGFSLAIAEDYADRLDADGLDFLNRIRVSARRMGELIDDLLNLSRVSRADLRRERVDLSRLASEVIRDLRQASLEREVEVVIAPDLFAHADKSLMRVVLENLLGNAWKYTGKTPAARIEVSGGRDGDQHGFFVRDNGAGYDPRYAQRLFQPFQRLHRQDEFPGHGIGLATVLRVVRRHGGEVSATGKVGHGAEFRFTIPASPSLG